MADKIDIHDKINQRGIVDAWARYTIEKWQKAQGKRKIGKSGALKQSFSYELHRSGYDISAVTMRFAMYGRFVDMGAGRGLKSYQVRSNLGNIIAAKRYGSEVSYVRRQPKKWYNKIRAAQTYRLGEIMSDANNTMLLQALESSFTNNITVKV